MINMNDILMFENIHGYTENGNTFFLIDDIVKELGLTVTHEYKNRPLNLPTTSGGQEYYTLEEIRWSRVNSYLAQYNLPPVSRGQYVHEDIAVYLAIKANNEKAKAFHHKLVKIIIPYFRDNITKEEYNRLVQENTYYKTMIDPQHLISSTIIAKSFNMSPQMLHNVLVHLGIIYKNNGTYALHHRFVNLNLAQYKNENGKPTLYWTEAGRQFIYNTLQYYNIHPNTDNSNAIHELGKVQIPVIFNGNR